MNDWFEWNGVKSTTYNMKVLGLPSAISPLERTEPLKIPGRSGAVTFLEGADIYDEIAVTCTCIIDDPLMSSTGTNSGRITKIVGWLKGDGEIKFANMPSGYYRARVANQISFDKVLRGNPHVSFQVQFRCQPFFFLTAGKTTIAATSSPKTLTNPGNMPSQPLLRVTGTGEGVIMCGGSSMIIEDLSGISYLMADCEAKVPYKGALNNPSDPLRLLGSRVSGDWLTIPTGTSSLTFTGGITGVTITPRWRSI